MDSDYIRLDMHIHSRYSPDSILTLREIHKIAFRTRISPVICDHNTTKGSIDYAKEKYYSDDNIPSLISEEIRTTEGEIIGLFLNEEIRPYQSPEETLDHINDQAGIAIIPHPGDRFRKSAMEYKTINSILPKIHALEVYNSRTLAKNDITAAERYANEHNLPVTGGSDAHSRWELNKTTIRIKPFDGPKEFINNLFHADIQYQPSIPFFYILSVITKKVRR